MGFIPSVLKLSGLLGDAVHYLRRHSIMSSSRISAAAVANTVAMPSPAGKQPACWAQWAQHLSIRKSTSSIYNFNIRFIIWVIYLDVSVAGFDVYNYNNYYCLLISQVVGIIPQFVSNSLWPIKSRNLQQTDNKLHSKTYVKNIGFELEIRIQPSKAGFLKLLYHFRLRVDEAPKGT